MHTSMPTPDGRAAAESGAQMVRQRVIRVAQAGRLRVPEHRAVELIRAAGTGVVFTLIDEPEDERDTSLADLAWEAVCTTTLTDAQTTAPAGPITAAVTPRAALPDTATLTAHETALLGDWLDRIAES